MTLAERASPEAVVTALLERARMLGRLNRNEEVMSTLGRLDRALAGAAPGVDTELARFAGRAFRVCLDPQPVEPILEDFPDGWPGGVPAVRYHALASALEFLQLLGRWDELAALVDRIQCVQGPGEVMNLWRSDVAAFDAAWSLGDWSRADDLLTDWTTQPAGRWAVNHDLTAAWLAVHRGDRPTTQEALGNAAHRIDANPGLASYRPLLMAVVAADAMAGGPPPGEVAVAEADFNWWWVAMREPAVRAVEGEWLVATGRVDEAVKVAARARSLGPHSRMGAIADRVEGLAAGLSDPAEGRRLLLAAADRFADLAMPFEAARARLEAGRMHPRRDDRQRLAQAADQLQAIGAGPWEVEARRLLGQQEVGPSRRPQGLTPREREVAALVAEGLTNAEIAERLYVSIRTVTSHLDHAYTKLGIGSRAALAAHVTRAADT